MKQDVNTRLSDKSDEQALPGLFKTLGPRYFLTEGFHLFAEASWVPAAGCLL
jgi:hypothetical protein